MFDGEEIDLAIRVFLAAVVAATLVSGILMGVALCRALWG